MCNTLSISVKEALQLSVENKQEDDEEQSGSKDATQQLREMFPHLRVSYLRELVELTGGDIEYAAAIALEAKPEDHASEEHETEDEKEEEIKEESPTPEEPHESPSPLELEAFEEPILLDTREDERNPPPVRLSREFLKSTYAQYSEELGIPKLMFSMLMMHRLLIVIQ